jgi:hypothetical protein
MKAMQEEITRLRSKTSQMERKLKRNPDKKRQPVCWHCDQVGHVIAKCPSIQAKRRARQGQHVEGEGETADVVMAATEDQQHDSDMSNTLLQALSTPAAVPTIAEAEPLTPYPEPAPTPIPAPAPAPVNGGGFVARLSRFLFRSTITILSLLCLFVLPSLSSLAESQTIHQDLQSEFCMAALSELALTSISDRRQWLLDSGASRHLTGDRTVQ